MVRAGGSMVGAGVSVVRAGVSVGHAGGSVVGVRVRPSAMRVAGLHSFVSRFRLRPPPVNRIHRQVSIEGSLGLRSRARSWWAT